jgi:hypothetical protein
MPTGRPGNAPSARVRLLARLNPRRTAKKSKGEHSSARTPLAGRFSAEQPESRLGPSSRKSQQDGSPTA